VSLLDIALKNNSAMKIKKWFKKLFGVKTVSTKKVEKEEIKNEESIQFGPEKTTKNKWLHPKDNFGKLKRGTQ